MKAQAAIKGLQSAINNTAGQLTFAVMDCSAEGELQEIIDFLNNDAKEEAVQKGIMFVKALESQIALSKSFVNDIRDPLQKQRVMEAIKRLEAAGKLTLGTNFQLPS